MNELKEMYDRSVVEIDGLRQQIAARDQLITGIAAIMGPIRLDLEMLDKVNEQLYVGYDIVADEEDDSITIIVREGESDEPKQGSKESK